MAEGTSSECRQRRKKLSHSANRIPRHGQVNLPNEGPKKQPNYRELKSPGSEQWTIVADVVVDVWKRQFPFNNQMCLLGSESGGPVIAERFRRWNNSPASLSFSPLSDRRLEIVISLCRRCRHLSYWIFYEKPLFERFPGHTRPFESGKASSDLYFMSHGVFQSVYHRLRFRDQRI